MKPQYEPQTLETAIAYLVEECGKVLAAAGKSLRWGVDSVNPELLPDKQERNIEWLLREMEDLNTAMDRVSKFHRQREYERYEAETRARYERR